MAHFDGGAVAGQNVLLAADLCGAIDDSANLGGQVFDSDDRAGVNVGTVAVVYGADLDREVFA